MKKLIKNGLIYDGTGNKPYKKNIVINGDKITEITEQDQIEADQTIDASGLIVTPGFVDIHRHCDITALYDDKFGEIELAQGLTTVIGGNCGLGAVPTSEKTRKEVYDFIEPCLGIAPSQMKMESFSDYLNALNQASKQLHMGSYIGTGAVSAAVKGYTKSPFTKQEMELAKSYIKEGLDAGAVGVSMGLMYQPECYSSKEEILDLLSAATPYHRLVTCHIRGEGDNLIPSVKEVIELAKRAELPLNISHFKATGVKNWNKNIHQAIELIEEARAAGQDVTVDFYPYCGGSTTLLSLIPPSVMEANMEALFLKLSKEDGKNEMKREVYKEHQGWDNMVTAIGWERILISSVTKEENRKYTGLNFKDASEKAGYSDPCELMCELLVEEVGKVGIIVLSMSNDDVDTVAKLPYSIVISDALYGVSDSPHPRLYGSFPKIIREFVMERGILTLENAIQKMTDLPAKRLQISGRGKIATGNFADINIFDPKQLKDHATFDKPKQLCTGFSYVLSDGNIVVEADRQISGYKAGIIRL